MSEKGFKSQENAKGYDKDAILRGLANTFSSPTDQKNELQSLSEFLALKSSGTIASYTKAIQDYSAEKLGKENWVIGLVGMLYDKNLRDANVVDMVISRLMDYLDDKDIFFVRSIVKGIVSKSTHIPEKTRQRLIAYFIHPKYRNYLQKYRGQYVGEELTDLIASLFDLIAGPDHKYDFLKEMGSKPRIENADVIFEKSPIKNKSLLSKAKHKIYLKEEDADIQEDPIERRQVSYTTSRPHLHDRTILIAPRFSQAQATLNNVHFFDPAHPDFTGQLSEIITQNRHLGFQKIVILLPHENYFPYVKIAIGVETHGRASLENRTDGVFRNSPDVEVVDTRTYGLAFQRILEDCSRNFSNQKPLQEMNFFVRKRIENSHYWLIPKQADLALTHAWVRELEKNATPLDPTQIPVIKFENTHTHLTQFYTYGQALRALIDTLPLSNLDTPTEIIIEHHLCHTEAQFLKNAIQLIYPANRIQIQYPDPSLITQLGEYIGVYIS